MYHDAPVEAAVTVHRHRRRPTAAAHEATERILRDYQLRRVADFLLTGIDSHNTTESLRAPLNSCGNADEKTAQQAPQESNNEQACCSCCTACSSTAPYVRVALQFPDELLSDSVAVVAALQLLLTTNPRYTAAMQAKLGHADAASGSAGANAGVTTQRSAATGVAMNARPPAMDNPHSPVGAVRLFVLADNTFGSCCPDEITAQHYMTDCIVHFGDACMSRSTRLPVLYIQPAFHFDVLRGEDANAESQLETTQEAEAVTHAEARVVLGVVERVATALRARVTAWCAEQGGAASGACSVSPRLTVVGTYPTKLIMQQAEQYWMTERRAALGDAAVAVDWPRFEERNGVLPALSSRAVESAMTGAAGADTNVSGGVNNDEADNWLVNGVRFHRVSSEHAQEVQYLLFFGAAGSSALVHVLTAEQYNEFHYSDACREFLEWDSGEEATSVPTVTVVNNTFGVDCTASGDEEDSATALMMQGLKNAATAVAAVSAEATEYSETKQVCWTELDACVSRWLSTVSADGASALVTGDYVVAQQALQRRVRQRAFNIETVRASTAIGILVASLAIEGYYELTQQLHQLIRAYGKRSYVIYVGHLNEFKLANFVDTVDCFVAVACPYSRQSHFPEKRDNFMKPIVSPAELLVALTTTDDAEENEQYGMAAVYTTSFDAVLRVLRGAVAARKAEMASRAAGDAESSRQRKAAEEERWASSGALVRAGGAGGGALTVQESSQGALARLYEREFVGLDPRIGQTPVQTEVLEGKHGIARGYAKEREAQHAEPPVSQYK